MNFQTNYVYVDTRALYLDAYCREELKKAITKPYYESRGCNMTNLLHVGRLVAQICERTMHDLIDEEIAPLHSASPHLKPSRRVKQHSKSWMEFRCAVSSCMVVVVLKASYSLLQMPGRLNLMQKTSQFPLNEWFILTKRNRCRLSHGTLFWEFYIYLEEIAIILQLRISLKMEMMILLQRDVHFSSLQSQPLDLR